MNKPIAELVLNLDEMQQLADEKSDDVRLSQVKVLSDFTSELTPKQQYIITSRYFDNATYREIATHFDISRQRVMQLEQAALKKMRKVAVKSGYLRRSYRPYYWEGWHLGADEINSEGKRLRKEGYGLKKQAFEILSIL